MKSLLFILLCSIALPLAQESLTDTLPPTTSAAIALNKAGAADSGTILAAPDTAKKLSRIPVVKRNLQYRAQIGAALGMMAFLTVILGSTQNWNP